MLRNCHNLYTFNGVVQQAPHHGAQLLDPVPHALERVAVADIVHLIRHSVRSGKAGRLLPEGTCTPIAAYRGSSPYGCSMLGPVHVMEKSLCEAPTRQGAHQQRGIGVPIIQRRQALEALLPSCVPQRDLDLLSNHEPYFKHK